MLKRILPNKTIQKLKKTVRRICTLILELKQRERESKAIDQKGIDGDEICEIHVFEPATGERVNK